MRLRHDPRLIRHVTEAKEFGRVAVMFGGTSSEREISLKSGNACLAALLKRGVDAHPFDPKEKPLAELVTRKFDRVFIALHGPGGEDGTLQGALEFLGLPYTGSGVMGSAIGMDKLRTKRLALASGIPTTDYMVLRSPADLDKCLERLGLLAGAPARLVCHNAAASRIASSISGSGGTAGTAIEACSRSSSQRVWMRAARKSGSARMRRKKAMLVLIPRT